MLYWGNDGICNPDVRTTCSCPEYSLNNKIITGDKSDEQQTAYRAILISAAMAVAVLLVPPIRDAFRPNSYGRKTLDHSSGNVTHPDTRR